MNEFEQLCMESILEKNFVQQLHRKDLSIVSFDIFETLVFRDVEKPLDIFTQVGKNKYVKDIYNSEDIFCEFRIQAEKKARKNNKNFEEITLDMIYDEFSLEKKQKNKIKSIEIFEENQSLYINKQIERWIDLAKKANKKVILISDMYLSKKIIEKIVISKLKCPEKIDEIYVSSCHNATKASGNLFLKILKLSKIQPQQLLHVGDHPISDFKIPRSLNITALNYTVNDYVKKLYAIEYSVLESNIEKGHNYRQLTSMLNPYTNEKEAFFFELGANIFGPIMWEFVHWSLDLLKKYNITQLNTIMREGRIFKKYISKLDKDADVNLVYASRKSTFLPSLNSKEFEKNNLNFFNYRKFSIENFYMLFNLPIQNKNIFKYKHTLLHDSGLIFINKNSLSDLIAQDFQKNLANIKQIAKQENLKFLNYLETLHYKTESAFIDFGGTGTILQNINEALPQEKKSKLNILFYMHESGYNKMLERHTISFLKFSQKNKSKLELLRRSPEFIEILFNGAHTTTLGYETTQQNEVLPITDKAHQYFHTLETSIECFDKGIDAFFATAKQYKIDSLYSRDILLDILIRLLKIPTIHEANYLGDLVHDEGYGSDMLDTVITNKHIEEIHKIGLFETYYKACENIGYKSNEITWINGAITKINPTFIQNLNGVQNQSGNLDAIRNIMNILEKHNEIKNIAVYGSGQFYEELTPFFSTISALKIVDIFDTRAKFSKFDLDGFKVKTIENADFDKYDAIVVASGVYAQDITNTIMQISTQLKKNVTIINCIDGWIQS